MNSEQERVLIEALSRIGAAASCNSTPLGVFALATANKAIVDFDALAATVAPERSGKLADVEREIQAGFNDCMDIVERFARNRDEALEEAALLCDHLTKGQSAMYQRGCGHCANEVRALKCRPADSSSALPKLVLALPDYEQRRIVVASDEMIDGERVVCVAIKGKDSSSAAPSDGFDSMSVTGLLLRAKSAIEQSDPIRWSGVTRDIAKFLAAPSPTGESLSFGSTLKAAAACCRMQGSTKLADAVLEIDAALATPRQTEDGGLSAAIGTLTVKRGVFGQHISTALTLANEKSMEGEYQLYARPQVASTFATKETAVQGGVPEAEPVAWIRKTDITELTDSEPETNGWTPLYAAPTGASK